MGLLEQETSGGNSYLYHPMNLDHAIDWEPVSLTMVSLFSRFPSKSSRLLNTPGLLCYKQYSCNKHFLIASTTWSHTYQVYRPLNLTVKAVVRLGQLLALLAALANIWSSQCLL